MFQVGDSVVVDSLFIVPLIVCALCVWSLFRNLPRGAVVGWSVKQYLASFQVASH